MKKALIILSLFFIFFNSTLASYGDVLYIKYSYINVVSSEQEEDAEFVALLKKGYVVLDQGETGDYVKIKLTDGKIGYILKSSVEIYPEEDIKVKGDYGNIENNTFLLRGPINKSNKLGLLTPGTLFKIMHVNFINNKFAKIKILNGKYKDTIGYVDKNNANIINTGKYKNDIDLFVEKYYNSEEDELNSATELPKNNTNSGKNTSSSSINTNPGLNTNSNNMDDFMDDLDNVFRDEENNSDEQTGGLDDFVDNLNNVFGEEENQQIQENNSSQTSTGEIDNFVNDLDNIFSN